MKEHEMNELWMAMQRAYVDLDESLRMLERAGKKNTFEYREICRSMENFRVKCEKLLKAMG